MHDYAIFGHSRATIGRWLGVASVILTGAVSSLLVWLYEATNIEAFATAIITPAIIYFVLHYCFDRFGWKIPFFSIPNISGIWSVKGETLNEDGGGRWIDDIRLHQAVFDMQCISYRNEPLFGPYSETNWRLAMFSGAKYLKSNCPA